MSDLASAYREVPNIANWTDPYYTQNVIFQSGRPFLRCQLCGEMFEVKGVYKLIRGRVSFYISYIEIDGKQIRREPNYCDDCFRSTFEGSKKKSKKKGILDRMRGMS